MSGTQNQSKWRVHAPSGKKYYPFRQNGKLHYHFEDGRNLTEREFEQLTGHQDPLAIPRSELGASGTGASGTKASRVNQLDHTNSSQAEKGRLSRDINQSAFPEAVVGSPPSRNYTIAHRSALSHPDSQRQGADARPGTTVNSSDRNSSRHSGQTSVPVSQPPRDDHQSAGTSLPPRLSRLSQDLVAIPMGSYARLYSFILDNPEILAHTEIDSLIAEARTQERIGNRVYPQTFVHHAMLLRKCREMEPQDRGQFFKRLDDRSGDVLEKFVKSVKVVYATIQEQARTALQQPEIRNPQVQGGAMPLVVQQKTQTDRHDSDRSNPRQGIAFSTQTEAPSQHEIAPPIRTMQEPPVGSRTNKDNNWRPVYRDEHERLLTPGISRNDPDRYRRDTDDVEGGTKMARLGIGAPTQEVRARNTSLANAEGGSPPDESLDGLQRPLLGGRRMSAVRMPTLHEGKAGTGREFKGTDGEAETLDPRYKKRPDAKTFFTRGRVFSLLWHEPAGQGNTDMSKPINVTRGRFGDEIFSHILRMVVVKEAHGACLCLPVNTYGGRGVSKPGLSKADREAHSIIHMSDTKPFRLPEETDMNKKPIAVDKSSPDRKLDEMSRLNFSRVHTVIWNVKVMNVGTVSRESMPSLVSYWKQTIE